MSITAEKREALENTLKVHLTDTHIEEIRYGWRAFYNEPEQFTNDVIVDMVLLDIGLKQDPNWDSENKKQDSTKEDVKMTESLNISDLFNKSVKIKNMGDCDTGVYKGKIAGYTFPIVTTINKVTTDKAVAVSAEDFLYKIDAPRDGLKYNLIICVKADDYDVLMQFDNELLNAIGSIQIKDLLDTEFEIYAMSGSEYSIEYLLWMSLSYVPFANGAAGSKIPAMWKVTNEANISSATSPFKDKKFILNGLNPDSIDEAMSLLTSTYPSVDLDTEAHLRYVPIEYNGNVYMYNRNHIGYNGNISNMTIMAPLIFFEIYDRFKDIAVDKFIEYIKGNTNSPYVLMIGQEEPVKEVSSISYESSVGNSKDSYDSILAAAQGIYSGK